MAIRRAAAGHLRSRESREPPRVSSSGIIVILSGAKLILHVVEAYIFTLTRLLLHAPSVSANRRRTVSPC